MTFTHEMGHILGGWCCGGTLADADLLPWRLPYSFFKPDPHPLITLWCGPILGIITPLTIAALINRMPYWFIAYFCMLANGVYIAAGWFSGDSYLDTTQLFAHGASRWSVLVYCAVSITVGYLGFRKAFLAILVNGKDNRPVEVTGGL